ncbi:CPBP family intramembrane metalloprotease [Bacteroidetes/Chlorobi group bacterium Naka2016]|jgi:membrane protease YdiL (CAAX protease family)|nr:MAG: CPBP family intramembrane metalloprotease [Bacteroidetes/Chlorobi group bacterium Naka2016]
MKRIVVGVFIAIVLWFIMFSPFTAREVNFWAVMFLAGIILSAYSIGNLKNQFKEFLNFNFRHILVGIFSTVVLYLVFFVGKYISVALFDFSQNQISSVYSTKQGTPLWVISLLLLFVIGPAEEIFWRGFIFTKLNEIRNKPYANLLWATLLYTFVHIWALNLMLLIAAFVCGLFWGYLFLRYKSLVPVIISHSLWDFAVFVLFPLN